jgi:hypothetical protein
MNNTTTSILLISGITIIINLPMIYVIKQLINMSDRINDINNEIENIDNAIEELQNK